MGWGEALGALGAGAGGAVQGYQWMQDYQQKDREIAQRAKSQDARTQMMEIVQMLRNEGLLKNTAAKGDETRKTLESKSGYDIALEETKAGGRSDLEDQRSANTAGRDAANWDRRDKAQGFDWMHKDQQFGQTFGEAVRSHKAGEALDQAAINARRYGIDVGARVSQGNNAATNATSEANSRRAAETSNTNNLRTNQTRERLGASWLQEDPMEGQADPLQPVPPPAGAPPSPVAPVAPPGGQTSVPGQIQPPGGPGGQPDLTNPRVAAQAAITALQTEKDPQKREALREALRRIRAELTGAGQ